MDIASDATIYVAVLSLGLSGYALWRQHQSAGRAHFTAEWETTKSIVYLNHGPGAAHDVRVELDAGTDDEEGLSPPYVGAFQPMRIHVLTPWTGQSPTSLRIAWRDNRLKQQVQPIPLSQPPRRPERPAGSRDGVDREVRRIAREEVDKHFSELDRKRRWRG